MEFCFYRQSAVSGLIASHADFNGEKAEVIADKGKTQVTPASQEGGKVT